MNFIDFNERLTTCRSRHSTPKQSVNVEASQNRPGMEQKVDIQPFPISITPRNLDWALPGRKLGNAVEIGTCGSDALGCLLGVEESCDVWHGGLQCTLAIRSP
ncbi:hypothetical protein AVEN_23999-1 [Araneus ventricosus]|uniref:Uncharacterized protein n=1 Tax=Araneus ventricosus TaxID=182803 RepID=A0A4Y2D014_ARAVE|nr:hypothetical protein AVEN_23999-1 [Araneus ventricosus]